MNIKKIRIKCYFTNSERMMARAVLGRNIALRKIIDPYAVITNYMEDYAYYELSGEKKALEDLMDFLKGFIKESDLDMEIYDFKRTEETEKIENY